jgi:hypothetical protein
MIDRDIIRGLIVSNEYTKLVKPIWRDDLVEAPEMRRIGRWCIDHHDKFGRVPNRDIAQIFLTAVRDESIPKAEAEIIESILSGISDDDEAEGDINAAYLLEETTKFFQKLALKGGIEEASAQLDRGHLDQAVVAMTEGAAVAAALGPIGDLSRARLAGWRLAFASLGAPAERLPDPWADPEPPPFDLDVLPPVLREFARAQAAVIGCHPGPMAWATVAACGVALDASIRLQMKATDLSFAVPPGLWFLLVAKPSQKKSPVLKAAFATLLRIQSERIDQWLREKELWATQDPETRGPEPRLDQLITHEATIEGIRDALVGRDRGIAVLCDEWAQHIGSMGRYAGGRDAGMADRAFYNSAFEGGPYVANRANRRGGDRIVVGNLQITVVGGVQPGVLRQYNRHGELLTDGMLQRSCPILMGRPALGRDDVEPGRAIKRFELLIRRLVDVPGHRTLRLSPEAEAIRRRLEVYFLTLEQNEALGEGFATAAGKLHGIWGRLALVLQHVRSASSDELPEVIDGRAAERAERLVLDSLVPNMAQFYQMLGTGGDVEMTRAVCAFLLRQERARVTPSDITRHVALLHRSRVDQVRDAVSPLIAMGWLTPEGDDERRARGWEVNPAIYPQFAEQAAKARPTRRRRGT